TILKNPPNLCLSSCLPQRGIDRHHVIGDRRRANLKSRKSFRGGITVPYSTPMHETVKKHCRRQNTRQCHVVLDARLHTRAKLLYQCRCGSSVKYSIASDSLR
ncbi:MAG TPA: hypothetical protein PLO50_08555, partial [Nitrospira sp.]|nr:hypothetical protein [Nitrospira sp.]